MQATQPVGSKIRQWAQISAVKPPNFQTFAARLAGNPDQIDTDIKRKMSKTPKDNALNQDAELMDIPFDGVVVFLDRLRGPKSPG